MLDLVGSLTPLAMIATGVLVPLFLVCWSIFALVTGRQGGFTMIKALVSLVLWAIVSYAMFVMFFIGTYMGGASPSARNNVSAHEGNIVLVISTVIYMAIGYGLAVWARGKPRADRSSVPLGSDG